MSDPTTQLHHHGQHPWCQEAGQKHRLWMLHLYDPDEGFSIWAGEDAEEQARAAYARYSGSWSCTLFAAVEAEPTPSEAGELRKSLDQSEAAVRDAEARVLFAEAERDSLLEEVKMLSERLEITHVWQTVEGVLTKVPVPEGADFPDGIACRDETIKLLEANRDHLRERVAELEEALKGVAHIGELIEHPTSHQETRG